jgi:hypothetical protein
MKSLRDLVSELIKEKPIALDFQVKNVEDLIMDFDSDEGDFEKI